MRGKEISPTTAGVILAVVVIVVGLIGWMFVSRERGGTVGPPPLGVPGAPAPAAPAPGVPGR